VVDRDPYQRRMRKDGAIYLAHILLCPSEEHLTLLCRCPPADHLLGTGQDVLRKDLGNDAPLEIAHKGVKKRSSQRDRLTENWRLSCSIAHLMLRDECPLVRAVY
jgi:hypothetical protein